MVYRLFLSILIVLFSILTASCDKTEKLSSKRVILNVSTEADDAGFSADYLGAEYEIAASSESFFETVIENSEVDPAFIPQNLRLFITLTGDLIPSMLENPNGYHVTTQFQFEGGSIKVNHTNQASRIVSAEGDTLFAIHGEGIVSSGSDVFENISGLFFEESTYKIMTDTTNFPPRPQVQKIDCRYELIVDY